MRLFLSSYRLGNSPKSFVGLIATNKNVAIITNARDDSSDEEISIRRDRESRSLEELGLKPAVLDLRDYYYEGKKKLRADLEKYGALWVTGGNVFVLRTAMKLSGFDKIIADALNKDQLVYAGYSAAGCVLSPSLNGYEIVDDATEVQRIYDKPADFTGLGIIDYHFEPHYKSDHPESADVDKEIEYLEAQGIKYKTIRDGQAIVINGDHQEIVG
jgi:dipeptidase E